MSRALGSELPAALWARLSGRDLAAKGSQVIQLFTVDPAGWPHAALVSDFEVAARDRQNIRIALYGDSRTTANARANGKATLVIVEAGAAYYVKGTIEELAPAMRATAYNAKLNVRVHEVLVDEANPELEPGAYIASGITYVNPQRAAELERAKAVIAELLE